MFGLLASFLLVLIGADALKLHRDSMISADEELPRVVYGLESCDKDEYNAMVKAQLETWGSDLPRKEFVIVGSKYDDHRAGIVEDEMPCGDEKIDVSCKEAVLLDRAATRARELNAQWVSVGQDDKYVWTKEVARALAAYNASEPIVIAQFGCGQAWQYNPASGNGTKPAPAGYPAFPVHVCDEAYQRGGICGGATYFVSRAALDVLRPSNESASEFRKTFLKGLEGNEGAGVASDIVATCMYYDRGIPIQYVDDIFHRTYMVTPGDMDEGVDVFLSKFKSEHGNTTPLAMHLATDKVTVEELIRGFEPLYPSFLASRKVGAYTNDTSDEGREEAILLREAELMYFLHKIRDLR